MLQQKRMMTVDNLKNRSYIVLKVSLNIFFIIPIYIHTFVTVGITNKTDDKAVTELKESSTNDNFNSELSKYEVYLKEEMKNDISSPINVSDTLGSSTAPTAATSDAENSVHLAKVNVLQEISSNLICSSSYSSNCGNTSVMQCTFCI